MAIPLYNQATSQGQVKGSCFCENKNKPQHDSSPASELHYVDDASLVCRPLQETPAEPQLHPFSSNRKPGLSYNISLFIVQAQ